MKYRCTVCNNLYHEIKVADACCVELILGAKPGESVSCQSSINNQCAFKVRDNQCRNLFKP